MCVTLDVQNPTNRAFSNRLPPPFSLVQPPVVFNSTVSQRPLILTLSFEMRCY